MGTGIRLHSMLVAWDWARRSGWEHAEVNIVWRPYAVDLMQVLARGNLAADFLRHTMQPISWVAVWRASASLVRPAAALQVIGCGWTERELYRRILPDMDGQ
ncbi:MAG: hypothetical protein IPM83_16945 [Ignavibacteria bacterium]|nr:hypothetical protein [Ignavibacteria bacterium]